MAIVVDVRCDFCSRIFFKDIKRVNESRKRGWKFLCSYECYVKSRTKSKLYKCSRPGCNNTFLRQPGEIKSINLYCSHSCSAKVTNLNRPKKVRICPKCGEKFTGFNKYCSIVCRPKTQIKYTKEILIRKIVKFFEIEGRIPLKREYGHYHAARERFGSWNNAIKAAGYEPNPVMFAKKYIALDGHKCDSLVERIIDDYLSRRKIPHRRSVPYPGFKGYTADFVVGKTWIEFFGLSGELRRYDELKKDKIKIAQEYNMKMIEIYPGDIFPKGRLEQIFANLQY